MLISIVVDVPPHNQSPNTTPHPRPQRAAHRAPLAQAVSRGIACQQQVVGSGGLDGTSAAAGAGYGSVAAAGLGAAAAIAAACGIALGGQEKGVVGCQDKEKVWQGGDNGGGGGGGGGGGDGPMNRQDSRTFYREDSRSAMWPNRDRPSEWMYVRRALQIYRGYMYTVGIVFL